MKFTYLVTLRAQGRDTGRGRVEATVTIPVTIEDTKHGGDNRLSVIKSARPLLQDVFVPPLAEAAGGDMRWEITAVRL
jgi:hypothetical protein